MKIRPPAALLLGSLAVLVRGERQQPRQPTGNQRVFSVILILAVRKSEWKSTWPKRNMPFGEICLPPAIFMGRI